MSLTVSTLALSSDAKICSRRLSSDKLMYTIRQPAASCGLRMRLTTTRLPKMASLEIVESRLEPNGSWPSTQMENEFGSRAFVGHSINFPKLYRYAAFISYSVAEVFCALT